MTLATATRRSVKQVPGSGRDRRPADHGAWFLVLPALIPILVLSVGPLLYGIALAFTDSQSGRTTATQWTGVLNFQDLLHDTLFWDSFRIGLLWAVGVTVPQFLLALGLALLLDQELRFRWPARALAIIPWAMPEVVVGIMWRLVYNPDAGILNETLRDLGLGDGRDWLSGLGTALPAVIVVGVWAGMPQTTVALLAGLQNTPRELHEAAAMDGAGAWRRFRGRHACRGGEEVSYVRPPSPCLPQRSRLPEVRVRVGVPLARGAIQRSRSSGTTRGDLVETSLHGEPSLS
ncbi:carbohydrate ABC transporter permease [Streptomyces sp. NBC_00996]|uniref:carbohydrate ABC transporter permease n=1 Tax=Streptomyces sp. NBC_00996 TaxID=2903710 RepID=UPI0038686127|nr:sugar ABC transporter permease [Streptomyces sp. NBC_00996]